MTFLWGEGLIGNRYLLLNGALSNNISINSNSKQKVSLKSTMGSLAKFFFEEQKDGLEDIDRKMLGILEQNRQRRVNGDS